MTSVTGEGWSTVEHRLVSGVKSCLDRLDSNKHLDS